MAKTPPAGPNTAALQAALQSGKKKTRSGYTFPLPGMTQVGREDQGQDFVGKVGSNVVAIGDATVNYSGPASGFGQMVIYTLTSGKYAGTRIYVGHAAPIAGLHAGQKIAQGSAVATLLQKPGGNATTPGWTEIGIADDTQFKPKYGMNQAHLAAGMFKSVLGVKLTPDQKAAVDVNQATATATTQAGSGAYNTAKAQAAGALAVAKATMHEGDPWVTVQKDKKGNVISFGEAIGSTAPKNTLQYGGQPVTKSELSTIWNSRYASIYEDYTGNVPGPQQIVDTLESGLSSYGLQAKLASLPTFKNSPIYKHAIGGIQSTSQSILGTDIPKALAAKAIAYNWDQNTLAQNLRTYVDPSGNRPYLQGPEFTNASAAMKTTYQKIYGQPDATATQAIKEAAGTGWSTDAFASYLRSQPQYTTSLEYQAHAVGFMDQMGILLKQMPTLKVSSKPPAGGQAVANSPLVPGAPSPLKPAFNLTPHLADVPAGAAASGKA